MINAVTILSEESLQLLGKKGYDNNVTIVKYICRFEN